MNGNTSSDFLELAIERKMFSNKSNLKFHLDFLFKDVELADKTVLDVGGGTGLLTFYAAVKGAKKAVCLEPESDGSSSGMIKSFNELKSALSDSLPVQLIPTTLQDYTQRNPNDQYDVVVMHASINHLDEEACINLLKDQKSYNTYKEIFTSVYNKMRKGGRLVVVDCSNANFFNSIGVKNVFAPTIEWHKHQAPGTWISLLEEVGFKNAKVEWRTPNSLGKVGKILMGNSLVSFLTYSRFKFIMEK